MSARLMCPSCSAFRTPDEVDFAHTPVRCKECGTAIEVFDEQLEVLDRQLAMVGRQSEMVEPYPGHPIYRPDDTQVTASDSQTPFTRMLQFLLGTCETISLSATSGIVSCCLIALFLVVATRLNLNIDGLSSSSDRISINGLGVICLSMLFAIIGGQSIGWLFIRPIASVLCIVYPGLDRKRLWIISTTSTCLLIAILALYPFQQLSLLLQAGLLFATAAWAVLFGIVGGFLGATVPTGKGRQEARQYPIVGGAVTGSLLMSFQMLLSLMRPSTAGSFNGPDNVVEFCLALAGVSLVATLPYLLIVPLSIGASGFMHFGEEFHPAYVLISGIAWGAIGYLIGGELFMGTKLIDGLVYGGVMGLCGACGGWAVGEFRAGA